MGDMLSGLVSALDKRYERNRTPVFDAIVDGVVRNSARQITGVTAIIQGAQGVPVQVSGNMVSIAPGQMFHAENLGTPASPVWSLRGGAVGGNLYLPRVVEFGESGDGGDGGDLLLGDDSAGMANFFFDESQGAFYGRFARTERLGLLAIEGAIFVGNRLSDHVWIDADGVDIKNGSVLLMSLSGTTGIKQYSGGAQRSQFNPDGSGWLAGPTKFFWDTYGDISIAGNFQANSLQLGQSGGGRVVGGRILPTNPFEFDPADHQYWGIRVYDETGLPRITLATGSVEDPRQAIFLLGAETDEHWLRFTKGLLKIKGEVEADAGKIGGFSILTDRLVSTNGRIRLFADSELDYGEGIRLIAGGTAPESGVVIWFDPEDDTWSLGLDYTTHDSTYDGWIKYSHVSTPRGVEKPTKHVWVSGGWNSGDATMEFGSDGRLFVQGQVMAPSIYTQEISAYEDYGAGLHLHNVTHTYILDAQAVTTATNNGNMARVRDLAGFPTGIAAQLLTTSNGYEVPIPLRLGGHGGSLPGEIRGLKLYWGKSTTGAHFDSIVLVRQNIFLGTKTTMVTLTNVGLSAAAGSFETVIVPDPAETGLYLNTSETDIWYLVVKPDGIVANTDAWIHGLAVSCLGA